MQYWKPIVGGSAIAAAAFISFALMNRPSSSVMADSQPPQSWMLKPETATLPTGTKIYVRLEQAIHSEQNSAGDHFTASLAGTLAIDDKVLAPSRSKVIGQLTDVKESGRVKGFAQLTMVLQTLIVEGKEYNLLATKGAPVAYGPESWFTFTLSSPLELHVLRKIGSS